MLLQRTKRNAYVRMEMSAKREATASISVAFAAGTLSSCTIMPANLLTLCPFSSLSTTDNEDIRCGPGFTIFTLWRGYQCTVCASCAPSQPSRPGTSSTWPLLQQSLCEFLRLAYLGHKVGPGVCKIALCGGDIIAECVPSVPRLNRRDQVLAPGPSCSNLCAISCGWRI